MIQIICGSEPYLVDFEARKLIGDADNEYRLTTYKEWSSDIINTISEYSFFGNPVVVVRCADIPKDEEFLHLTEIDSGSDYTLVILPENLDKRTSVYKSLNKKGLIKECTKFSAEQLISFIVKKSASYGMRIEKDVAQYLGSRIGYFDDDNVNLYTVAIAVRKLYFSGCTDITKGDICMQVEENINCKAYELFNMLLSGNMSRYFMMYEEISRTENSIGIISCMLRSARIGLKAIACKNHTRDIGVNPAAFSYARHISIPDMKCLCDAFEEAVRQLKKGVDESLVMATASFKAFNIFNK